MLIFIFLGKYCNVLDMKTLKKDFQSDEGEVDDCRWWSEALGLVFFSFGGRTGVKEHSITVHFNHRRYSNSKILENTLLIHIYRKKREIKEETIKWFRNMPPKIRRGHEWNGNGPWSWTYGPNILYFPCFIKSQFKKKLWEI